MAVLFVAMYVCSSLWSDRPLCLRSCVNRAECQASIERHRAECDTNRKLSIDLEKERGRVEGMILVASNWKLLVILYYIITSFKINYLSKVLKLPKVVIYFCY